MNIFLPVAGLPLNLLLLAGLGALVGLLSGLLGVGGAFLLTPFLLMLGVPATVATASGLCMIVATSSSGTAAHFRLGNVDLKLGILMLVGGLAGGALGVEVIEILHALGDASLAITLAYVFLLGGTGGYMFLRSFRTLRRGTAVPHAGTHQTTDSVMVRLPWQMEFPRSGVRHSVLLPLSLAVAVGVVAAIMGVGGGFIRIPIMVYLLAVPTHVAVGTNLFQIALLGAGVTYMQAVMNHTVDLVLVLPLAFGSALGAQLGARLSRLLRGDQLMILLATVLLVVAAKMAWGLVAAPPSLLEASRFPETSPAASQVLTGTGFASSGHAWLIDRLLANAKRSL